MLFDLVGPMADHLMESAIRTCVVRGSCALRFRLMCLILVTLISIQKRNVLDMQTWPSCDLSHTPDVSRIGYQSFDACVYVQHFLAGCLRYTFTPTLTLTRRFPSHRTSGYDVRANGTSMPAPHIVNHWNLVSLCLRSCCGRRSGQHIAERPMSREQQAVLRPSFTASEHILPRLDTRHYNINLSYHQSLERHRKEDSNL